MEWAQAREQVQLNFIITERQGTHRQADYALPFHDSPCNALSRESFSIFDVYNIREGTFAFSIYTICGGDAFSNSL